jgi:hypothetical protein
MIVAIVAISQNWNGFGSTHGYKIIVPICDYNIKGLIDYRSVYLELIIWKSTSCQV